MTTIELRVLQLADLRAIEEIERRSYPTPWSRSMFAGELAKPSSICLGAFEAEGEDGELCGYLIVSRYVDAWHVMNIAVDPDHRGRGIATTLLERLFELTADDARRGYTLEVRVSNATAIALYERLGFESRGIRRGYYTDNREDALIMWKDPVARSAARVILGLETSCDETAAAVITEDGHILSNVVASQADLHAEYGGVVPEVASRRHLELVTPVIREALGEAGATLEDITKLAVTQGPGLIGALLVGLAAAKAIAWSRRLTLAPVDHLQGHVASLYLQPTSLEPPFLCLLASGGHTLLLDVQSHTEQRVLGTTLDDAAGEAFDKGARLLGLALSRRPGDRPARARRRPDGLRLPGRPGPGPRLLLLRPEDGAALRHARASAGRACRAAGRPRRFVPARDRPRARGAGGGGRGADRCRADRGGRRRGGELRAARVPPRRHARAARPLHRQRGDDRVGGAVRGPRPVPRISWPRCIRLALSRGMPSCLRCSSSRRRLSCLRPAARAPARSLRP